jgi:hypothetical protein
MNELAQLAKLCERLGASQSQAAIMAAQLLKRAAQIAAERGLSPEAALAGLVEVLVKGRSGEVPPRFSSPPSP